VEESGTEFPDDLVTVFGFALEVESGMFFDYSIHDCPFF
jgi:hypothetical protein